MEPGLQTIQPDIFTTDKTVKNPDHYQRDIFFKTVATYTVGLNNHYAAKIEQKSHPLTKGITDGPYLEGNGGLIYPELLKYEVLREPINTQEAKGVRITVQGLVRSSGIQLYQFDERTQGHHHCDKNSCANPCQKIYKMSLLEAALLGALKERMHDRLKFHGNTESFYHYSGNEEEGIEPAPTPLSTNFQKCIQREWTSRTQNNPPIRCQADSWLIQRYMPDVYTKSLRNNPPLRTGEYIRLNKLNGNSDPLALIELNEFTLEVKISDEEHEKCLIQ